MGPPLMSRNGIPHPPQLPASELRPATRIASEDPSAAAHPATPPGAPRPRWIPPGSIISSMSATPPSRSVELALDAPRRLTLDVEGMACASCVNRIERYLRKLDGVEEANVNLATNRATVVAGGAVSTEAIIAAVEAAGYDARPVAELGIRDVPTPAV